MLAIYLKKRESRAHPTTWLVLNWAREASLPSPQATQIFEPFWPNLPLPAAPEPLLPLDALVVVAGAAALVVVVAAGALVVVTAAAWAFTLLVWGVVEGAADDVVEGRALQRLVSRFFLGRDAA